MLDASDPDLVDKGELHNLDFPMNYRERSLSRWQFTFHGEREGEWERQDQVTGEWERRIDEEKEKEVQKSRKAKTMLGLFRLGLNFVIIIIIFLN